MHPLTSLALLTILGAQIPIQSPGTPPIFTFDLHFDRRCTGPCTLTLLVARAAHLYFVVSSVAGSQVLQTTDAGVVESSQAFPSEQLTGFDLNHSGTIYALLDRSRLVQFDSQWNVLQTQRFQTPLDAFAVVGGKPMGISPDRELAFLDTQDGTRRQAFTLISYPGPWQLFASGPDRISILQPQTGSLHVFQVDGDWSRHAVGSNRPSSEPPSATAADDGRIFIAQPATATNRADITQYDDHGNARFQFRYELPPAFAPRLIASSGDHILLADSQGRVAAYPLDPNPAPSQSIDSGPELLSDTETFKAAVRQAAYTGPVTLTVDIGEDGAVDHAELQNPLALDAIPELMNAVRAWHFLPALRSGKPASVHMEFNLFF